MAAAIRTGWQPGLAETIVQAHAEYYAREWGFGAAFEAKVAREIAAFAARYDGARDCVFSAEDDGQFLGSLTIDGHDLDSAGNKAHLRWFIVSDAARGQGIGRILMNEAMHFVRAKGFQSTWLTTFAGLDSARKLYEAVGFVLREQFAGQSWGREVIEQRFVADLLNLRAPTLD